MELRLPELHPCPICQKTDKLEVLARTIGHVILYSCQRCHSSYRVEVSKDTGQTIRTSRLSFC